MDLSGIIPKYKTNRPLTEEERASQLQQKQALAVEPKDELCVIKANSTYLELVDKYYGCYKGWFTMWPLICISVFVFFWLLFLFAVITSEHNLFGVGFCILTLIFWGGIALFIYFLRTESFTYTHYPVRFNRKTRRVHVFMVDGRQISVPWDEVFFYVATAPGGYYNLRGHVLAKDGETVLDTFDFMAHTPKGERLGLTVIQQQWEFARRYMEEDYTAIINQIVNCMPIDGKRETWAAAWNRLINPASGAPLPVFLIGLVLAVAILPFRMIAMRTSKIPQWNAEIEAANVIDANDPYIKDSRINPEGLR